MLVTAAWFLPLLAHLNSSVLVGPNDETYAVRSYWGAEQDGKTPFTWKRDSLNGAPEGFPFASAVQIANFVQPGFVWVLRDVLGLYGAFNVFLLLGFALTGFAVYFLLDRIGISLVPALFAGYAVAFNPWMIERAYAGHAGYMHAWVFPVLLLAHLHAHKRRTIPSAIVVGLVLALSFYVSSYYGLIASLLFGVFWLVDFALARGWPEKLWTLTLVLGSVVACGGALLPAAVAWARDRASVSSSISNDVQQLQNLGASAESYVLPATRHPVLGAVTRSFDVLADKHWAENTLYLGWTTIVLALIGAVLLLRQHPAVRERADQYVVTLVAAVAVPLAFLFSLKRETSVFGVDVPMPSYLMGELTAFWRVYARFGIIVLFGLALLAAFALHVLSRRRGGRWVAAAALGLLVFEFLPGRVPIYRTDQPEPYAQWLARQPSGIVADYPLPTDSSAALDLLARSFYQQMEHRQPSFAVFGSGYGGTREEGIRILSRYLHDPLTPGILRAEGVRYILVHDDVYREQGDEPPPVPAGFVQTDTLPDRVRVLRLDANVVPVDLDAVLEEQAANVALVRGLTPPAVTFGDGVSEPVARDADAFRTARDGATIEIQNDDPRVTRMQMIVKVRGIEAGGTLRLAHRDGSVVAEAPLSTDVAQIVVGPFAISFGMSSLTFRVDGPAAIEFAQPQAQPLADFSTSLREG